jgi:hypothetical protein
MLLVGALVGGCAAPASTEGPVEAESSVTVVDADVYGSFPVDPPAPDEIVLTLVGSRTVELTMAELEALARREVTLVEPFVKATQTFRVVALAELLELAGITPRETVDTIALNDYRYRDGVRALLDAEALLAVERDGEPIPMDAGGPIRLVYDTASTYYGFLDAWNWSLRRVEVVDEP